MNTKMKRQMGNTINTTPALDQTKILGIKWASFIFLAAALLVGSSLGFAYYSAVKDVTIHNAPATSQQIKQAVEACPQLKEVVLQAKDVISYGELQDSLKKCQIRSNNSSELEAQKQAVK
jgi:hypothetical protein